MKFAVVVVLLAVALGIEASGLTWGATYGPALSYTAVSGPALGHGAWGGPATAWGGAVTAWGGPATAWGGPATTWGAHGAWGVPAAVDVSHGAWGRGVWGNGAWAGVPAAVNTHAAVVPAVPAWGHEGSYVAKTRGATHVAPLAGHANSAVSINLQPAPGTVH